MRRYIAGSVQKKAGLIVVGTMLALLATELGLRTALVHSPWKRVADPEAYFDPLCDDDYWIALGRGEWASALHRPGSNEQDPRLGWVPDRRRLDSFGAWPTTGTPDAYGRQIALFGDSYVFGTVEDGFRLSDALQARRSEDAVRNFGVGGYGLGQSILRFEDRLAVLQPGDQIVMGVLTTDLDRTVLSVRDAPKPQWFFDDGMLQRTEPGELNVEDWFPKQSIAARSVLWARLSRTVSLWQSRDSLSTDPACRVAEKTELARALLKRLSDGCEAKQLDCVVVLFHRPIDLMQGAGWRVEVVQEASTEGLRFLDTGPLLLETVAGWSAFYGEDAHPNVDGNAKLAEWLDPYLPQ